MKSSIILKSLSHLPSGLLEFAASAPGRALNISRHALGMPAQATRREIRLARRRTPEFASGFYARVHAPFHITSCQGSGFTK
jgi:hypothetical protein